MMKEIYFRYARNAINRKAQGLWTLRNTIRFLRANTAWRQISINWIGRRKIAGK
jgi:hypothetical protein